MRCAGAARLDVAQDARLDAREDQRAQVAVQRLAAREADVADRVARPFGYPREQLLDREHAAAEILVRPVERRVAGRAHRLPDAAPDGPDERHLHPRVHALPLRGEELFCYRVAHLLPPFPFGSPVM